jgi:hypothetical protein
MPMTEIPWERSENINGDKKKLTTIDERTEITEGAQV